MALDSLEKRRNVPGVGRPWMRMIHPTATPDQQWRMAVGLTYGGAALSVVTAGTRRQRQIKSLTRSRRRRR